MPDWNESKRLLRMGDVVIKQFRRAAPNMELVLAGFQRAGWPRRIDDPLPREPGVNPKQHLHDTIQKLNRTLTRPLIHFCGDGTGRGVCWRPQ